MGKEIFFLLSTVIFLAILCYTFIKRKKNSVISVDFKTMQENYIKSKNSATPQMSMKEKLDLSWQPIRRLTDYILSKFSESDINKLAELGQILLKHGMKYIHVIDYAIPKKNYVRTTVEQEKEQSNDKQQISR